MNISSLFSKVKNLLLRIRSRLITEYTIMYLYPSIYRKYSEKALDADKVIFIESRLDKLSNSFQVLYQRLGKETDYKLKIHFLRKTFVSNREYINNCKELIRDMATAKYVFMDEATHILGRIQLRDETELVQLWHGCGAFKKFGYSAADGKFGASRRAKERYPVHTNYTLATVSSKEVIPHFENAMNSQGKGTVQATGVSRTDIFYDEEFIAAAFRKLYSALPEAENKKIILYAPTFRGNVEAAAAPDRLDTEAMEKALGDRYILLVKHHPLVRRRPEVKGSSFAFDFSDVMSVEELLCVSDICISDYSSLIFEYSLFERPMIFFAYDLKEYFDSRGFYYDYDELTPGPVFKSTKEITDYIDNIENNFDINIVKSFREKFMSACDGKATDRIIDKVFGEEYGKHLRR